MSEDLYFWNKSKKEYIIGYGNHNRKDSLRYDFPKLLVWLMSNDWKSDNILCIGDSENIGRIFKHEDKTNHYIIEFNKSGYEKEHGKLLENRHAKKICSVEEGY